MNFHRLLTGTLALCLTIPAFADAIGSTTTARSYTDGTPGQVYIYGGDNFAAGDQMSTFSWYNSQASPYALVTPILFDETSYGVFQVAGVGAVQLTGSGLSSAAFDLQFGTDIAADGNYTFGFIEAAVNGSGLNNITSITAGGVDFNGSSAPGPDPGTGVSGGTSTNTWYFTPSDYSASTLSIGDEFYLPDIGGSGTALDSNSGRFNVNRTYSAEMITTPGASSTPEPGTILLFGSGLLALAGSRKLFRANR